MEQKYCIIIAYCCKNIANVAKLSHHVPKLSQNVPKLSQNVAKLLQTANYRILLQKVLQKLSHTVASTVGKRLDDAIVSD